MRRLDPGVVMAMVLVLAAVGAAACSKDRALPGLPDDHATREREPALLPRDAGAGPSGPVPHEDESERHEELPNKVRLPPSVVRAAGIETAPAVLDSLPATVDLTGEIAADPDRSARIAARIPDTSSPSG